MALWRSFTAPPRCRCRLRPTLAAEPGAAQGELVLASSPPPVSTEASDHGGWGPKRHTPARAATPIASTASAKAEPAG